MAEEQKNGLAEALETGASAAHLARGAIKAGKAVSGAAKGAAAGGPYGAAAGALWEGRKSVGKFLAAATVLLLLFLPFSCGQCVWPLPGDFLFRRKTSLPAVLHQKQPHLPVFPQTFLPL